MKIKNPEKKSPEKVYKKIKRPATPDKSYYKQQNFSTFFEKTLDFFR